MTLRTVFLIDQVKACLLDSVVAMADDTLSTTLINRLTMRTDPIGIKNTNMTTTTEIGNVAIVRCPDKTTFRFHRQGEIGGIATMAIVTGDTVLGVNACAPFLHRRPERTGLTTMTLDADRIICQQQGRHRPTGNHHDDKKTAE
jgi:hypothetical protein